MKRTVFILVLGFGELLLAADGKCPDDWQKVLANYVAKDKAVHSLTYNSKITVSEAFFSGKTLKDSANFSVDRVVDTSGVNYPSSSFTSPPPQSYGSVEVLPGYTKNLAKGLFKTDSDANDPAHWTSKEISTNNYSISCSALDEGSANYPGKKVYKFKLTPLKGKSGLFNGQLWTDETGSPLEIGGKPTDLTAGVKSISFHQTYQKDENGYSFPHEVTTKLNLNFLAGGLKGKATATISDISDVQGENISGSPAESASAEIK